MSMGEKPDEILDSLGVTRYCCRRMIVSQVDLIDENALKRFVSLLGPRGRDKLIRELRTVDPAHPERPWEWIVAQLDGLTGRELAEQWGVVPSMVTQWTNRYLPGIQEVFGEFRDVAV